MNVSEADIMSTSFAVPFYLKSLKLEDRNVFVVGSSGLLQELKAADFNVISTNSEVCKVGAVIVGFDADLSYSKFSKAFKYLKDPNCLFVASNNDSTFPTESGELPGTGCIVSYLEYCSQRSATVIGKPFSHMMNCLASQFEFDPKRTCMIGDRLDTDILFGLSGKMKTLLVETGVHKAKDTEILKIYPDFILSSLADLIK